MCGQLFIRCRGEPAIVANCHCFKCQQRTGSVSSNAAFYRRADIIETGGQSTKFSRTGDRGYSVTNHFCPVCGSTVYWEREMPADWIGISVGSFADPTFPSRAGRSGRKTNIIGWCCRTILCRSRRTLTDCFVSNGSQADPLRASSYVRFRPESFRSRGSGALPCSVAWIASRNSAYRALRPLRDVASFGEQLRRLAEHHDAVADADRLFELVGDEDRGRAAFPREFQEGVAQFRGRHLVEMTEGLVGQAECRAAPQSPRDGDALAHAAGQFVRIGVGEVAKPQPVEPGQRAIALLSSGRPMSSSGSRALSSAERHGSSRSCWNTVAIRPRK